MVSVRRGFHFLLVLGMIYDLFGCGTPCALHVIISVKSVQKVLGAYVCCYMSRRLKINIVLYIRSHIWRKSTIMQTNLH